MRDDRLGTLLRELPVPEHREGFWEEVELRRSRPPRRLLWLAATAAAALVVVGLIAIGTRDGGERVATEPSDDVPRMVNGLARTWMGDQATTSVYRAIEFSRAVDGSFVERDTSTGETVAYDAEIGRAIRWTTVEGTVRAVEDTGLPPGPPVRRPLSLLGNVHDVEAVVMAGGTGGPTEEEFVADEVTGVATRRIRVDGRGAIFEQLGVDELVRAAEVDRTRFRPDPPAGAVVESTDHGFRRAAARVASLGDLPVVSTWVSENDEMTVVRVQQGWRWAVVTALGPAARQASELFGDSLVTTVERDGVAVSGSFTSDQLMDLLDASLRSRAAWTIGPSGSSTAASAD